MSSSKNLSAWALAIATLLPTLALAQTAGNPGYWFAASGGVVTSGSGNCWRTIEWTPALAAEPCDPSLKRAVAAPAPKPQEQVAQAPMPAPVPVVAKTPPQKVNFSADALFAFDDAVLKPEGKRMLDNFASQLNSAQYEQIAVTGHTDRIGNAAYNQKLSERRAGAVKSYLVSKNIPENRITISGKGKTEPVTAKGQCVGNGGAKVIGCLQPDRRVDIETKVTKTN